MATLGKTTDGASSIASSNDRKYVSKVTATEDGTVTAIHYRVSVSGAQAANMRGIAYADSANAPAAKIVEGAGQSVTENTATWKTEAVSFPIVNGTSYWIGVHAQDPGTTSHVIHCAATAGQTQRNTDTYAGGAADPFGTPTADVGPLDVYLTYTPSGGGGSGASTVIQSSHEGN